MRPLNNKTMSRTNFSRRFIAVTLLKIKLCHLTLGSEPNTETVIQ